MRKVLFSILLSVFTLSAYAQGTRIVIRSSELTKGFPKEGYARIIKPVFEHEGSTLAADSADFNNLNNTFDAFGHIVITQPSGTVIYSDLLNYDGNTKLAILTNNVRLIDGDAILTTSLLTYNMSTRMGTYTGGGKIVNGKNVLTSRNGYYFASTKDSYFRHNVTLTSPDALIKTDTLRYNTASKIAYFYGPTHIYGKDDTLYTENGTYNTNTDQARFGKNNLYTQGSKSMKGDSLFYDRKAGYGRAIGSVTFIDTAEKAELRGGIGIYRKSDESIMVTQNPYVVILSESDSSQVDSIWYTADTLFSKVVPIGEVKPYRKEELSAGTEVSGPGDASVAGSLHPPPAGHLDSVDMDSASLAIDTAHQGNAVGQIKRVLEPPADPIPRPGDSAALARKSPPDSSTIVARNGDSLTVDTTRTRIVIAYHNAKIFKSDLQAKADSMFFSYADSTVRCYGNPMLWSQGSQLSGDTIYLQLKNKKLDNMLLQHNSFIINSDDPDSTNFNQIKGKVMTGYFRDNKLDRMFVDGNAESIYYVKDDSVYTGLNHQVSSRIRMNFADGQLKEISFIRSVQASTTPMNELTEDERILDGFIWKPKDRPASKEEIIPQLKKKTNQKIIPEDTKPRLPVKPKPEIMAKKEKLSPAL